MIDDLRGLGNNFEVWGMNVSAGDLNRAAGELAPLVPAPNPPLLR